MDKKVKREIIYRVRNILEVCLFLGVSTWFWYGPRVEMQKRSELSREQYAYIKGVHLQDQEKISLDNNQQEGVYQFTLINDTNMAKDVLVRLVLDHNLIRDDDCKVLPYNRLHYYLSQKNEQNLTLKSLSISGEILITTLQPGESRDYTFKYFGDNELSLDEYHFHAKAVLSSGQNL